MMTNTKKFQTAEQWLKKAMNIEMPKGQIKGEWFFANDLPMVVRCQCCESTMILPSAMIDDEGNIFCRSCIGED